MKPLLPALNTPKSGTADAQKLEYEMRVMNAFRRLRPELGIGEATGLQPPAHDFRVISNEKVVGVELTRLVVQQSKAKEQAQDKAVAKAQVLFEAAHPNICVYVSVHWHHHPTIAEIRNQGYDKALAQLVTANLPSLDDSVELHWENMPPELWNVFHAVSVRVNRRSDRHWYCPRAGFIMELKPHEIIKRIADKESSLEGYRRYFSEVWLVIAHDGGGPSSFSELGSAVTGYTYETGFNRVFLMPMTPLTDQSAA